MKKLRRVIAFLSVASAVTWFVGPGVIHRESSGVLRTIFQRLSHKLVEYDMNRLGSLIESKSAALGDVKQKRRELNVQLKQMEQAREELERGLGDDRDVLAQIAETLQQTSESVVVGGASYSRASVESEARRYLARCKAEEAELEQLDAAISALAAGTEHVDTALNAAEASLAGQLAAYKQLRHQDDARQLRQAISALTADTPTESAEVLIGEVATLLQPLRDTPSGDEPRAPAQGDRDRRLLEIESYLASSGIDGGPH